MPITKEPTYHNSKIHHGYFLDKQNCYETKKMPFSDWIFFHIVSPNEINSSYESFDSFCNIFDV